MGSEREGSGERSIPVARKRHTTVRRSANAPRRCPAGQHPKAAVRARARGRRGPPPATLGPPDDLGSRDHRSPILALVWEHAGNEPEKREMETAPLSDLRPTEGRTPGWTTSGSIRRTS